MRAGADTVPRSAAPMLCDEPDFFFAGVPVEGVVLVEPPVCFLITVFPVLVAPDAPPCFLVRTVPVDVAPEDDPLPVLRWP